MTTFKETAREILQAAGYRDSDIHVHEDNDVVVAQTYAATPGLFGHPLASVVIRKFDWRIQIQGVNGYEPFWYIEGVGRAD